MNSEEGHNQQTKYLEKRRTKEDDSIVFNHPEKRFVILVYHHAIGPERPTMRWFGRGMQLMTVSLGNFERPLHLWSTLQKHLKAIKMQFIAYIFATTGGRRSLTAQLGQPSGGGEFWTSAGSLWCAAPCRCWWQCLSSAHSRIPGTWIRAKSRIAVSDDTKASGSDWNFKDIY